MGSHLPAGQGDERSVGQICREGGLLVCFYVFHIFAQSKSAEIMFSNFPPLLALKVVRSAPRICREPQGSLCWPQRRCHILQAGWELHRPSSRRSIPSTVKGASSGGDIQAVPRKGTGAGGLSISVSGSDFNVIPNFVFHL